jgi:hypothetical protein
VLHQNAWGADSPEGCTIAVRNDLHVAPAAELATTKGYPDIVVLENSLIQVTSIPNRGRLIFDYVYKPTGHSWSYTNTSPMPIETDQGYFLEFGGYYVSYPWNPRSNQPYDLEYDVVKQTPQECTIRITKKGLEFGIDFEALLTIKENDPSVDVNIKLTNVSNSEKTLNVFDRSVICLDNSMNDPMEIILPQGIDHVTIGKSADGWMGAEGKTVSWPHPWQKWGGFKGQGHFRADLAEAKERIVKVHDPQSKGFFAKTWSASSPYQEMEVSAWGPAYEDVFGAYPGFVVSNIAEALVISSGESRTFEVTFYASISK